MRLALLAALSVQLSSAIDPTELYSWHTFDTRLATNGRVDLFLHHRTRSRQDLTFFEQGRIGGIARIYTKPGNNRFFWLAGYYFQPNQALSHRWNMGHRVWGGFESQPVVRPGYTIMFRAVSERHMNAGRPAYFRHRTALRWTGGKSDQKIRPFVQNELLAVWPGFHSTRNSGGLAMKLPHHLSLEVSYLYDLRRNFWGGDRQAIVTSLRWTPKPLFRLGR